MEWNDNIDDVKEEVEREILKLESRRKHFLAAAEAATNSQYQHGQSESTLNLVTRLEAVSKSLLHACIIVQPDDAHLVRAMNRVKGNLPPAKRGKAERKDCEIYELFLSLCRDLRAQGLAEPCVFSSSNTKEYGRDNSGGVQPELNEVGAMFVTNLPWAVAAVDGRV